MTHTPKTRVVLPPDFFTLCPSHILLDTNVFIEALADPREMKQFFDALREHHVVLATIPAVRIEFILGTQSREKYWEKVLLMDQIIDIMLPHKNGVRFRAVPPMS